METKKRGFTLIELLVVISIIALLIGILLPAIGRARETTKVTRSLTNLKNFGIAHATYAAEWNGRQWTTISDDFTVQTGGTMPNDVSSLVGTPAVPVGFDSDGNYWVENRTFAVAPYWYPGNCVLGSWRAFNFKPFNQYVNGKYYDRIFWADKDYTIEEDINDYWADPGEWPGAGVPFYFPTYCMSAAAQVSPDVFGLDSDAGRTEQSPMSLPAGFRSPNLGAATYPDLKTHMLEHYWLQNNPSENIPGTTVPWFYNMGAESTPATLFFDGHTAMMGVREAVASSNRVQAQGDDSLVAEDPDCTATYFEWYAHTGEEISSYHVYTRDGIKGRDTTGSP